MNSIANEFLINSGATINITGNNFSNISNTSGQGIVATGVSTATINLGNNYWGSAPIPPKIKDHLTDPSRPYVSYNPIQPTISPPGVVTTAVATDASAIFSAADQTVTLTAYVTNGAVNVNEGTVMFTILDGIRIVGQPVAALVAHGVATAKSYLLPGGSAGRHVHDPGDLLRNGELPRLHRRQSHPDGRVAGHEHGRPPSANPSVLGQTIILTATVSPVSPGIGTPTGTVTFMDGATTLGTATLSGGLAALPTSMLTLGANFIEAVYGGDSNFTTSTSTPLTQTVKQDATSTTVTSSANPSVFGQTVVFTAVVVASSPGTGTPTGTVTFKDGATALGNATLSGGTATFPTRSSPSALATRSRRSTAAIATSQPAPRRP